MIQNLKLPGKYLCRHSNEFLVVALKKRLLEVVHLRLEVSSALPFLAQFGWSDGDCCCKVILSNSNTTRHSRRDKHLTALTCVVSSKFRLRILFDLHV